MGYYSSGEGSIVLNLGYDASLLTALDKHEAMGYQTEVFDLREGDGITTMESGKHIGYPWFYEFLKDIALVASGSIEFVGEDGEHESFTLEDGKVLRATATITYSDYQEI